MFGIKAEALAGAEVTLSYRTHTRDAHANGQYCNFHVVGDEITHEIVGMPLSNVGSLAQDLGQAFTQEMEAGGWEAAKSKQRRPDKCAAMRTSGGAKPMSIKDLSGAIVLLLAFVGVGLAVNVVQLEYFQPRSGKPLREASKSATDLHDLGHASATVCSVTCNTVDCGLGGRGRETTPAIANGNGDVLY